MKWAIVILLIFAAAASWWACGRKSYPALHTVSAVDLNRYQGRWYEIASLPNSFQKGCSCTYAQYRVTGTYVEVMNNCHMAEKNKDNTITGKAFVVDGSNNSRLKVQFFWPFKGDYYIIDLADDYSYALVGHPNRQYLWLLCRNAHPDESVFTHLYAKAAENGFDTTQIVRTIHNCP
jgi:apolipoprotein D and lipocalin family protein